MAPGSVCGGRRRGRGEEGCEGHVEAAKGEFDTPGIEVRAPDQQPRVSIVVPPSVAEPIVVPAAVPTLAQHQLADLQAVREWTLARDDGADTGTSPTFLGLTLPDWAMRHANMPEVLAHFGLTEAADRWNHDYVAAQIEQEAERRAAARTAA